VDPSRTAGLRPCTDTPSPRPSKTSTLSAPPPKIHRGSSPKFHATRDTLDVTKRSCLWQCSRGFALGGSCPGGYGRRYGSTQKYRLPPWQALSSSSVGAPMTAPPGARAQP
jgi:hypothetical protein